MVHPFVFYFRKIKHIFDRKPEIAGNFVGKGDGYAF